MEKPYNYPKSQPLDSSSLGGDFAFGYTGLDLYDLIFRQIKAVTSFSTHKID